MLIFPSKRWEEASVDPSPLLLGLATSTMAPAIQNLEAFKVEQVLSLAKAGLDGRPGVIEALPEPSFQRTLPNAPTPSKDRRRMGTPRPGLIALAQGGPYGVSSILSSFRLVARFGSRLHRASCSCPRCPSLTPEALHRY